MTSILNSFVILFLVCIIGKGYGCSLNNIEITQSKTPLFYKGNIPIWKVVITNTCDCGQRMIKVECKGFTNAQKIGISKFLVLSEFCVVNNGDRMVKNEKFEFQYAAKQQQLFKPISSTLQC
ncbi:hypothetical protein ACFE04_004295 [Oxalis oulophora]